MTNDSILLNSPWLVACLKNAQELRYTLCPPPPPSPLKFIMAFELRMRKTRSFIHIGYKEFRKARLRRLCRMYFNLLRVN